MSDQPQLYAAPSDYELLVEALSERRLERNISFSLLDELAGVPVGYTAKCLGGSETKRLGFKSLFRILKPLGLRITLEIDEQAAAEFEQLVVERDAKQARANNFSQKCGKRTLKRALRHLATELSWNEVLHAVSESRRAIASEQTVKAARKAARQQSANVLQQGTNKPQHRATTANSAGRKSTAAAAAWDAPMVEAMGEWKLPRDRSAAGKIRYSP